ncbi:unnamed protein product [Ectocarpus sp. 8 AP-2014]
MHSLFTEHQVFIFSSGRPEVLLSVTETTAHVLIKTMIQSHSGTPLCVDTTAAPLYLRCFPGTTNRGDSRMKRAFSNTNAVVWNGCERFAPYSASQLAVKACP